MTTPTNSEFKAKIVNVKLKKKKDGVCWGSQYCKKGGFNDYYEWGWWCDTCGASASGDY